MTESTQASEAGAVNPITVQVMVTPSAYSSPQAQLTPPVEPFQRSDGGGPTCMCKCGTQTGAGGGG